jgi:hypothetical protein
LRLVDARSNDRSARSSAEVVAVAAIAPAADSAGSPLPGVLLIVTAAFALLSVGLATTPLPALERLLTADGRIRSEQAADLLDSHRLEIAIASVATLFVVLLLTLPVVTR